MKGIGTRSTDKANRKWLLAGTSPSHSRKFGKIIFIVSFKIKEKVEEAVAESGARIATIFDFVKVRMNT